MATSDVLVQRWIAQVLAGLQERNSTKQKPSTVLRALRKQALTEALRRDLAEHLAAAGIRSEPPPERWERTTPWIAFTHGSPGDKFQISFTSERELSDFIVANWRRIPFFAAFTGCSAQHKLQGGRLICDLLLTRPKNAGVVVVELKKGKPGNEAITELFGYVAALKAEQPDRAVEAWLVTGRPNEMLLDDLEALAGKHQVETKWFTYGVSLALNAVR